MIESNFKLTIKGQALVLIDWANIRNQQKKLGWEIDLEKLYQWLLSCEQIEKAMFFYGYENNEKSKKFLKKIEEIGFEVVTKEVKYLGKQKNPKCDFDTEIACEIILNQNKYRNIVLFSGDGDFKYPLQEFLLAGKKKKIFIISYRGSIGKEIWDLQKQDSQKTAIVSIIKTKEALEKRTSRPHSYRKSQQGDICHQRQNE